MSSGDTLRRRSKSVRGRRPTEALILGLGDWGLDRTQHPCLSTPPTGREERRETPGRTRRVAQFAMNVHPLSGMAWARPQRARRHHIHRSTSKIERFLSSTVEMKIRKTIKERRGLQEKPVKSAERRRLRHSGGILHLQSHSCCVADRVLALWLVSGLSL